MASVINMTQTDARLCRSLLNVSDQSLNTILFVNFVLISGTLSVFGIIFNLINIAVFVKMGFMESTNITLLSLSISDTGVLLFMLAYGVLYNPLLLLQETSPELVDAVFYLGLAWPKSCFSRISASLTVVVALERFLCVCCPLRVKQLITVGRITFACVAIYAFLVTSMLPVFTTYKIGSRFNPIVNASTTGIISTSRIILLENISLAIIVFTQFSSFLLVFGFTSGTMYKLQQKTKWRNSISSSNESTAIAARDRRLVKMVIYVSIVFITCTLPALSGTILTLTVKDYSLAGKCKNIFMTTFSVFFCFGTVNSTINIFIYVRMSSKFRKTLMTLLNQTKLLKKIKVLSNHVTDT